VITEVLQGDCATRRATGGDLQMRGHRTPLGDRADKMGVPPATKAVAVEIREEPMRMHMPHVGRHALGMNAAIRTHDGRYQPRSARSRIHRDIKSGDDVAAARRHEGLHPHARGGHPRPVAVDQEFLTLRRAGARQGSSARPRISTR
jgi:hypothetical protein